MIVSFNLGYQKDGDYIMQSINVNKITVQLLDKSIKMKGLEI